MQQLQVRENVVGFEKALGAVKVIKDQIQYRSQSLLKSGAFHMIPGQLIAPGQLTDPEVNFALVHGLTPATVHMSFSLTRGNFERRLPGVLHRVTRLAEVTFLHVNKTQKFPMSNSSLVHAHY